MSDATRAAQTPTESIAEIYRRVRDLEFGKANAAALGKYLPLAGGTMTGNLNMGGKTLSNAVITGSTIAGYLPLTGGTLTGALIIAPNAAAAFSLRGGTSDQVYIGFYPDSGAPTTRRGWLGYGTAGSAHMGIYNEYASGQMWLATAASGAASILLRPGGVTVFDVRSNQINFLQRMWTGRTSGSLATTTAGVILDDTGYVFASRSGDYAAIYQRTSSNGNIVGFGRDSTLVGSISVTTTATAYNTSSDRRLKTAIKTNTDAIEKIRRLQIRDFRWKTTDTPDTGLIAQELAAVLPSIVTRDEETGYHLVDYGRLTPWLAAAVQDLDRRLTRLEEPAHA